MCKQLNAIQDCVTSGAGLRLNQHVLCKFHYRPRSKFGAPKRFEGAVLSYKHAKDMLFDPRSSENSLYSSL